MNNEEEVIMSLIADLEKSCGNIGGLDSDGERYESLMEFWRLEGIFCSTVDDDAASKTQDVNKSRWYRTAKNYWEDERNCPPTVDGVLGGFASISDMDLVASQQFLSELKSIRPSLRTTGGVCIDCGAGIGRISKGLLLPLGFKRCDLVEVSPRLISAAPDYIGNALADKCRYLCIGLQEFEPKENTYDLVWIQWVIGYLTDGDCLQFLKRCAASLTDGGVLCIKDNTCDGQDAFVVDKDDCSVIRSLPYLLTLCKHAGLEVVFSKFQNDFPDEIYPVPILALQRSTKEQNAT
mmetsp:Transcript_18555/g.28854  ORF Transcript_18555/g.28854 Transcript_18555/m.28854 type:complete len:293 (-) Transcript_18555:49-927(-)|eukprot:CAMPEP_0196816294 /NCGR_PEP_ID=MMETSP1362-20130617/54543_1 /TAXON_ID=163516 /ORGANISM="Leptocylindrus danicus, Strain CCMP1856" /LENGTH=292 /DNA_ID=CAMNT_0042193555 /DNA_START=14 /DNA_END=892 /DNA_ORIENTATION=+